MLEETQIGPLVDQQGFAKVKAAVEDAVAKGAKVGSAASRGAGSSTRPPSSPTCGAG